MKSISNIISIALIGGGAAGFAIVSKPLAENKDADVPLNVLGINRSPYGEVFAMAMQGPIDTYFHATADKGHSCESPNSCKHDHKSKQTQDRAIKKPKSLDGRLRGLIESMEDGLVERTNPKAATDAHKFFIRRGIEDKLRFAYNLDPSHYGNYNAYHFFLTQPQLGTRPELTPTAAKLAHDTISYCLAQRDDPRQALTAAAAAGNVIQLMFNDRDIHPEKPNFSIKQMREVLQIMDQSIGLFSHLSNEWVKDGQWQNLSELRVAEADERFKFILKIRESQEQTIRRLEGLPDEQRNSTSMNTSSFGR